MLLHQVINEEPPSPCTFNNRIPKDLETICLKCLKKDVRKRYSTAQELSDDLQCYLDGRPIKARPINRLERSWRWAKRNPIVASLGTSLAIVLISGSAALTVSALRLRAANAELKKAAAVAKQQNKLALETLQWVLKTVTRSARAETHRLRLCRNHQRHDPRLPGAGHRPFQGGGHSTCGASD
jgi:hypothetical protein